MPGILQNKVVAITGSGRGIGASIARLAAAQGARVVVNDLGVAVDGSEPSSGPAEELVREIVSAGGEAIASPDDCSSFAGAENIVKTAVDKWGRLDGLIHNAGILRPRMVWNMEEGEWDDVLRVHLRSAFLMAKFGALQMRSQNGGAMLFVTSSNGVYGSQSLSNYSAAKAGIIGLAKSVAKEMARYNVRALAYHIGADTRMTRNPERLAQARGQAAPERAGRRPNSPEMAVALPVYLLSDEAAKLPNLSGQVLYCGGETLGVYQPMDMAKSATSSGGWTVDQVAATVPGMLDGMPNPIELTRHGA